jgi:signal peptidase II
MKRKYLILFSLSGLVLALDQWSKLWISSHFELGFRKPLLGNWLVLVHAQNSDFAFGFFEHAPRPLQELFFVGVPVFALMLIVLIFIKLQDDQMATSVALSTILAGAIGNLIDRVQFGYVVDLLEVHAGAKVFLPLFNLADLSILTGVFLMFINTVMQGRKKTVLEQGVQE